MIILINDSDIKDFNKNLIIKFKIAKCNYNHINPDVIYYVINKRILKTITKEEEIILIGSGLGGFWANYFAQKCNLKCLLINPIMEPSKLNLLQPNTLEPLEYKLDEEICRSYKKYEEPVYKFTFRITLLSTTNKVYYNNTREELKDTYVIPTSLNHQQILQSEYLSPFIEKAMYTYPDGDGE